MADYFDAAGAKNDQVKASLLEAIRTQGSQARAAFDQAQQQIQSQRAQAIAAAVAEAAQRGAPQAVQGETTGTIAQGYDRRLADLASAGASNAGSLASISAQGGSYLDQATAAIPGLRARQTMANTTAASSLANRLATLKAQQDSQRMSGEREATMFEQTLADRKAQRDYEAEQRRLADIAAQNKATQDAQDRTDRQTQQQRIDELQLAIANANLGKATVTADAAGTKADTKAAALAQQQAFDAGQAPPVTPKQVAVVNKQAVSLSKPGQVAAGANYALPSFGAPAIATAAANTGAFGAKNQGNPDLGPTQVSAATIKRVSNSAFYKAAVKQVKNARAAGATPAQFAQVLQQQASNYSHPYPETVDILTQMYAAGQI